MNRSLDDREEPGVHRQASECHQHREVACRSRPVPSQREHTELKRPPQVVLLLDRQRRSVLKAGTASARSFW